jgi:hypothetical protein
MNGIGVALDVSVGGGDVGSEVGGFGLADKICEVGVIAIPVGEPPQAVEYRVKVAVTTIAFPDRRRPIRHARVFIVTSCSRHTKTLELFLCRTFSKLLMFLRRGSGLS